LWGTGFQSVRGGKMPVPHGAAYSRAQKSKSRKIKKSKPGAEAPHRRSKMCAEKQHFARLNYREAADVHGP
jgi:hypothetical protein